MAKRERKPEHYLPEELCADILSRLPVKPLLKFRCVCKTWCSLIENPNFTSKHLNYYKNDPKNDNRLFTLETPDAYDQIESTIRCGNTLDEVMKLGLGFNSYDEFDLVGHVNGVLCLKFYDDVELLEIGLSNPSIRKTKSLPLPQMSKSQKGKSGGDDVRLFVDLCFGFDIVKNEFKIVAMGYPIKEQEPGVHVFDTIPKVIEVYAQSEGLWRSVTIGSIQDNPSWTWRLPKIFVNGAVHLVGDDNINSPHKCTHLIAFDLGTEVLSYIELPECGGKTDKRSRRPIVYEESLGLLDMFGTFFCLWVMKEYGIKESWVMQYKITSMLPSPPCFVHLKKDGDLIYVPFWDINGTVIIYNVRSTEIRHLPKKRPDYLCFLDNYVESLVLLK